MPRGALGSLASRTTAKVDIRLVQGSSVDCILERKDSRCVSAQIPNPARALTEADYIHHDLIWNKLDTMAQKRNMHTIEPSFNAMCSTRSIPFMEGTIKVVSCFASRIMMEPAAAKTSGGEQR
jgi:hypothetical protein